VRYDVRNRTNLDKLAPNTRKAAYAWYEYCIRNGIDVLIYETIRTLETQKLYLANGKSQTLRSYHLVGQALDFVPVLATGATDYEGYGTASAKKAIAEAKRLGFSWGGNFKGGWDKPHLEYRYKGYGTDLKLDITKEDEEMTAAEKKDFEALQATVKEQAKQIAALEKRLNISGKETYASGYVDAVTAAKAAGAITTSADKSKLELNIIQMLYNLGLLKKGDK